MRKAAFVCLAVLCLTSVCSAEGFSVRDIGFIEVETKPYTLDMRVVDLAAPEVKKQQEALRKELEGSNITLSVSALDGKPAPDGKPIGDVGKVTKALFWVVAPDGRTIPFDPSVSMKSFLRSPLREKIYDEVTHALCTVVIIESTDEAANKTARAKVETVLNQVNQVRAKFDKAPHVEVRLLSLSTEKRPQERWTLWGLGEDLAASVKPKVAVLFGKMRRAGDLFEGDWKEPDLFARIAILAQNWDSDVRPSMKPALPFVWTGWPNDDQIEALNFNPTDPKKIAEADTLLKKVPVPDPKPRKLAYDDFTDHPGQKDPHAHQHPWKPEPIPPPEPIVAVQRNMPTAAASTELGIALLVVGIMGWIALAIVTWTLEDKHAPAKGADASK